jgi:hypothetical protein
MEARGWVTVGLTAVSGPVGGFVGALALGRLVAGDGMTSLVAALGGLVLGGPLLAFAVFGVCLLTILQPLDLRRGVAIGVMTAAALLDGIIVVAGLRAVSGTSFAEMGLIGLGMMSMALLGAGAHVAISMGDS